MGTRVRSRIVAGGEGTFLYTTGSGSDITSTRAYTASRDDCTDFVPGPDQALTVEHQYSSGHVITHTWYPDPTNRAAYKQLVGYPLAYFANGVGPTHQTVSGRPNNSYLAGKLLAATNPSKPVVDLPVSFLELRELPSLLRTTGDTLIKRWASKNLHREFGLTPLVADAVSLLGFTKDVAKRVELFKKLREKPLLRKASLWDGTELTTPNNIVVTNSAPAHCNVKHSRLHVSTQVRIWGYVRWTPDEVFNKGNLAYSDPALEYLARRAVTGTQLGAVTAWNAVPWTWLVDWFGNLGDWLEANRQVVPAKPSLPRLCIRSETAEYFAVAESNIGLPVGSTPVTRRRVTKVRTIASATLPSANLPLLTGRQIGILASLAALRM